MMKLRIACHYTALVHDDTMTYQDDMDEAYHDDIMTLNINVYLFL